MEDGAFSKCQYVLTRLCHSNTRSQGSSRYRFYTEKLQTQIQSRLYLDVILMRQFHFSFPVRIVRKFGILSSRTLRWKNTQDCLNCFLYAWELEISGVGMRFLYCLASRHGFYFPLCWSQTRLYRHSTVYSECYVSPRLGICNFAFHLALSE